MSLDMPDMQSSSESIRVVCGDSGGLEALGRAAEAAEAGLLFDDVVVSSKGDIASAAFLFFDWEGMVLSNEGELAYCTSVRSPGQEHRVTTSFQT